MNIHESWIRNTWPRPGMDSNAAVGECLVGRFLCQGAVWRFENPQGAEIQRGSDSPLEALNAILHGLPPPTSNGHAGAIGYISYEWGRGLLGVPPRTTKCDTLGIPDIQFLVYQRLTHPTPEANRSLYAAKRVYPPAVLDDLLSRQVVRSCVSKSRYLADVSRIKEYIADGDIYQANYTQAFDLHADIASDDNFHRVMSRLPAPYCAYLKFGPGFLTMPDAPEMEFGPMSVMAMSPERFWRMRGGQIDSRPIKGTAARANTEPEDREVRRRLLGNRKDRSELLMITDLVRNDLGQVADIGSVKTEALARIRPTPSVWHLESTVTGRLSPSKSWVDVMKALMPAGSISGTPKRRAVEILEKLEPVARGPYCGAIGWIDASGEANFAVGIRTCVRVGNTIRIHGGGGIVADSDPESEYYESLVKIAPLLEIIGGETDESLVEYFGKERGSDA